MFRRSNQSVEFRKKQIKNNLDLVQLTEVPDSDQSRTTSRNYKSEKYLVEHRHLDMLEMRSGVLEEWESSIDLCYVPIGFDDQRLTKYRHEKYQTTSGPISICNCRSDLYTCTFLSWFYKFILKRRIISSMHSSILRRI
jgi:hypothetical protein